MKRTRGIVEMNYLDSDMDSMWRNVLTSIIAETCEASAGNSAACGRMDLQHGRGQHRASKRLLEHYVCSKNGGFCW